MIRETQLETPEPSQPGLTDIERRLLEHAAKGLNDKQIATELNRHPYTVKHHMRKMREKFKVRTRFQLALHVCGLINKRERHD